MRRRSRGKMCALLTAAALGAAGRVWAGIGFDANGSTVSITHDRDISVADPTYVVNLGLGQPLGTVPRASTINPPTAPQMQNTFGSSDLAHSGSIAVGSLGQVTNNTTASFTLAS